MKGSSYLCSQIAGCVEYTVRLHVDIPHTCGRGSDLPSEAVLQEYLLCPYEYFLSLRRSGVTVVNLVLKKNEEKSQGLRSGERASQIHC
jgi:hypothetical protein